MSALSRSTRGFEHLEADPDYVNLGPKTLAPPFDPMCSCEHSLFDHHGTKGGRCLVCPCKVFTNK